MIETGPSSGTIRLDISACNRQLIEVGRIPARTMNALDLQRHRWRNGLHTLSLLAAMGAILALIGWLLAGPQGAAWTAMLGLLSLLFAGQVSPRMILRLYRARPLGRDEIPGLQARLMELARRAGLARVPKPYYVPSRMMSAFAVGDSENSSIALSDGLLRALDGRELTGVLAHEISHIRTNDIRVMGLADLVSRLTGILAQLGQLMLLLLLPMLLLGGVDLVSLFLTSFVLMLAPVATAMLQLALSRVREYDADIGAAELTGDPMGLAYALDKIERIQGSWLERVFLPGRREPDPALLRTHPDSQERIRRLADLAPREPLPPPISAGHRPHWAPPQQPPRNHWPGIWY